MKKLAVILIVPFIVFIFASLSFSSGPGPLELITSEEAAAPDLDPADWHLEVSRADDGPEIQIISPHTGEPLKKPVAIDVRFKKGENEVDPSTIRLEYLKFIAIDLTPRVKNYLTKDGIKVPNVNLPSGTHTIRLSVGDTGGAVTRQVFTFEVI